MLFVQLCLVCIGTILSVNYGVSVKSTASERIERYAGLLTEYFAAPRHPYLNEANWKRAQNGIIAEFESIVSQVPNASMEIQPFETQVLFGASFPSQIKGNNIIVTFAGRHRRTDKDQILVIGSHYDSDGSPLLSLDDNGSGVVAMLEVARGLADAILTRKAVLLNTVMFVAFDIQRYEHEHTGNSNYPPGSDFFVRGKLVPILGTEPKPSFLGAIVLDSVMNYRSSTDSQILPDGFDTSFPTERQYVVDNDFKGNYLAMVTKENLKKSQLGHFFAQQWNTTPAAAKYPLMTLEIRRSAASMAVLEFSKQDHMSFWNSQPDPLPAILLTDTNKWRFYGTTVWNTEFITKDRLEMLDQVVISLENFVSKSQLDGSVGINTTDGSDNVSVSIMATLLTMLISHIFKVQISWRTES